MQKSTAALLTPALISLFAQASHAATTVYENNFSTHANIAPGSPYSDNGWGAYVTRLDGSVTDETNTNPVVLGGTSRGTATANSYLWTAPKGEADNTDAGVDSLFFSTDLAATISLANLDSITVKHGFDGSVADPAAGRFAIRIGTTWFASLYNWSSTTEPGTNYTTGVVSGINFTDGANWLALTATAGGVGTGDISLGSAVGGTLTGDINAFGVFVEHGNGGDHARIDDFVVTAIPEPSISLLGALGLLGLLRRRR